MSTIAIIQVHQCDGCREVAVLHTDDDRCSFEANWFAGLLVDFCPACRNKVENAAAIEADEEKRRSLIEKAAARVFGDSETSQLRNSAASQLPREVGHV